MAGMATLSATDWNEAIRARPATSPAAAARSLSARSARSSSACGVAHQHEPRVGQPHPAARGLQQRHTRLALQHRQLLRDRRGGELERVGHRGDGAAVVQLAQQPESAQVQHP